MNEPRQLRLLAPTPKLRKAYLRMLDDFRAAGEPYHGLEQQAARKDFDVFLAGLIDQGHGLNLPPGRGPQSHYWAVVGKEIVGTIRLRHGLTDSLRIEGGHIGYDVAPSCRRKHYATEMLRQMLQIAGRFEISPVLITCNTDNEPSAKVIRANGGVYDGQSPSPATGKMVSRYWIGP